MTAVRYKELEGEQDRDVRSEEACGTDIRVARLVDKAVAGDYAAFGEIYSLYMDRIYRYVYYQVKNRMAAEDLTEEIFVKAWEAIDRYKQKSAFIAWLYRIAHNHVVDYFRTSHQHQQLDEAMPDKGGDIEKELEDKLMQRELAAVLSYLPPRQQQVIILKFIEELDNRQISRIMCKSEGAIRVLQMRALVALRQIINGEKKTCEINYLKHLVKA